MNQIIRELNAAADAVIAASETGDDTYLRGFAGGIRHATRILDDSDTSGPSEPYRKQDGIDTPIITDYHESIRDRADAMVSRTESYLAHGY